MWPALVIAILALALSACSPVQLKSGAPCETTGLALARSLDGAARPAAAFVSDVADVVSWESHAYGNGVLQIFDPSSSAAPLDRVDVCYYEGAFNLGGHPFVQAGAIATFRPNDLLLVTIDRDGNAKIATAGYRATMPLASPPHGP